MAPMMNCLSSSMRFSFAQLDYHGKSRLVEIGFLFFLGVLSPLAVGLQIFSRFSYVLSLVFVNILNLPAVIFFYRIYLPYTIGRGRYFLTILLLFPYLLLYELNSRLSTLITIAMPFIPQGYRNNLASGHPWDF